MKRLLRGECDGQVRGAKERDGEARFLGASKIVQGLDGSSLCMKEKKR